MFGAFLRGFAKAAGDDVEGWGRDAYEWLRGGVQKLFASGENADVATGTAEARGVVAESGTDEVLSYAAASDTALRNALHEYGLDWVAAERVATTAREAGLTAIGL